jgi:hypothetical protein
MTSTRPDDDPVLARLAALPDETPARDLTARIRAASLARLRPRPLHLGFTLLVAGSALGYLLSALRFTLGLF